MFTTKNPDFEASILKHLERQEFMKLIGCRLTKIELGYVEAEIELQLAHQQQVGLTHGGVIATIADVAAGFAGFTLVGEHQQTVTVELKTSYFTPAIGTHLRAVGRVMKAGRTLHFCEAEVFVRDAEGVEKLCAKASTTMAIVDIH